MVKQKTADRIISFLVEHNPTAMSDGQIAAGLSLPTPSVRRTRSKLEDSGMLVWDNTLAGVNRFRAASYLVAARQPETAVDVVSQS